MSPLCNAAIYRDATIQGYPVHHDLSYGIIPLRRHHDQWQVLLVQHGAGHWSFPKGHPEPGEDPQACATRELYEETQLAIQRFLTDRTFTENYVFQDHGRLISKTVTYYVAEVEGMAAPQAEELITLGWFSFDEANSTITFPAAKKLLADVILECCS